ncbi:MAG TPA: HhH-GPD-type base excision DNA repair protein [Euzebyales bacterium]
MTTSLAFTGDATVNRYLSTNHVALLVGLVLDQHVPTERAYIAPRELARRLFTDLDAATVASLPVSEIESCFRQPPALHRYPGVMARRVHRLCRHVRDRYDGDAAALWTGVGDASVLYDRIRALPGFDERLTRVLVALLGKRLGVRPTGWERVAGDYALPGRRSVADVVDRDTLQQVRTYTRAHARISA